jgi:hypothetical protein
MAKKGATRTARMGVNWGWVEPFQGIQRWWRTDRAYRALRAAGIGQHPLRWSCTCVPHSRRSRSP